MVANRVVVDFFYDVVSPYSWVAFEMLCRYRHEWHSMSLRFRPVLVGAVMKMSGNSPPMTVANKAMYMLEDIKRLNHYYKVPVVIPDNFVEAAMKKGTLNAMRFITAIDILTDGQATEHISRQFWIRIFQTHQDVTLVDSFREAAKCANIDTEIVKKAIKTMTENEAKELLRSRSEEVIQYGAFGVPTTVLHLPEGPQLVFGSDRMEIIGSLLGVKYVGPLTKYSKL